MRVVAFALLASSLACAQAVQVRIPLKVFAHPVEAFHETPTQRFWMIASTITFQAANGIHAARGGIDGSAPRGVRLAGLSFGATQWILPMLFVPSPTYNRLTVFSNFALAVPLAVADFYSIRELK